MLLVCIVPMLPLLRRGALYLLKCIFVLYLPWKKRLRLIACVVRGEGKGKRKRGEDEIPRLKQQTETQQNAIKVPHMRFRPKNGQKNARFLKLQR